MTDCTRIIDYHKLYKGWGAVWQGGGGDIAMHEFGGIPNDRLLVEMASDIGKFQPLRDMKVIFFGIEDGPHGVLTDAALIALVGFLVSWLAEGNDVVIGCVGGVSRSSYINIAVMMAITGDDFDKCLARIREARPQANPMQCFVDHLKRMHVLLKGLAIVNRKAVAA